ncbi:hypothetical protein ACF3NW_10715 [Eikenella halliae]|uniref:hypothetical protein n=1 Tax=Eikenella halliae TaxID=1795832 RepID=UPI00370D8BBD
MESHDCFFVKSNGGYGSRNGGAAKGYLKASARLQFLAKLKMMIAIEAAFSGSLQLPQAWKCFSLPNRPFLLSSLSGAAMRKAT